MLVLWPVIAAVLVAVGWSLLLAILESQRREAELDALREAETLSRSYAGHLDRAIEENT